jgi:cytochrome c biogenesis protein CcmG, thiol:disulfide interchange protein DsbE
MRNRLMLWVPLGLFLLFFAVVASGLIKPANRTIASKMVGKPLPTFSLAPAHAGQPGLGSINFRQGKPRILNLFASWCLPCIAEAPVLLELRRRGVEVDAIAIRDRPADLDRFLKRNGNPYGRIGADNEGAVQLSLGSSGVPESFIVDGRGIIRYQHIGDIRREDIPDILNELGSLR